MQQHLNLLEKNIRLAKCPPGDFDEMSVGEMSVGEMSVGEVSVGEMSVGEMSWIRSIYPRGILNLG